MYVFVCRVRFESISKLAWEIIRLRTVAKITPKTSPSLIRFLSRTSKLPVNEDPESEELIIAWLNAHLKHLGSQNDLKYHSYDQFTSFKVLQYSIYIHIFLWCTCFMLHALHIGMYCYCLLLCLLYIYWE